MLNTRGINLLRRSLSVALLASVITIVSSTTIKPAVGQVSPAAAPAERPTPPTRDPHTAGIRRGQGTAGRLSAPRQMRMAISLLVPTTEIPRKFLPADSLPNGTVIEFTMNSSDSKIYPGIARDVNTFGTVDPKDPAKLVVTTSHPAPYARKVAVYVPKQYVADSVAPFIVGADGPDRLLFSRSRHHDRATQAPGHDRHFHRKRRRRRAGQPARTGVRHHVRALCRICGERSSCRGSNSKRT